MSFPRPRVFWDVAYSHACAWRYDCARPDCAAQLPSAERMRPRPVHCGMLMTEAKKPDGWTGD